MASPFVRSLVLVSLLLPASVAAQAAGADAARGVGDVDSVRLTPGDQIRLEIRDEPELGGEYLVDQEGRVLLPLIGLVAVAGRPFPDVVEELRSAYAVELADSEIRVLPVLRIAVLGEVRQPGLFPADPTHTTADLIAVAGGLTPQGDPGKIRVVRDGEVLVGELDPGSPALDRVVRSGDQIIVGRRSWLSENASLVVGSMTSIAVAVITALLVR